MGGSGRGGEKKRLIIVAPGYTGGLRTREESEKETHIHEEELETKIHRLGQQEKGQSQEIGQCINASQLNKLF